ncbi:Protein TIFY 10A [Bienertia sinuspersici]
MGSEMMFLAQKQAKSKSNNFTQTCNRFSQFLKERRSLGHLDAFKSFASSEPEIKGSKEVSEARHSNTMKNSFPKKTMERERVSLELFPLMNSRNTAAVENSTQNMSDSDCRELPKSNEESETTTTSPSMTIFYGGKVLIFNELPEDKAQEIMSLVASHGTISSQTQTQNQTQTLTQIHYGINTGATHHLTQGIVSQGEASNLSDLPIARRVSLHRFMEKRKHRLASSAPYQLPTSSMAKETNSNPQKFDIMSNLYEQQLELKL